MTVEEFARNLRTTAGQGYTLAEWQRVLLTAPDRFKLAIIGGPRRSASRSS